MAKTINPDTCILCEACVVECPNEGISVVDDVMVIDPNLCTECAGMFEESQCMSVCPTDSVEQGSDESQEVLLDRAAKLHPDRFPRD